MNQGGTVERPALAARASLLAFSRKAMWNDAVESPWRDAHS
jgi:hypothetical protein